MGIAKKVWTAHQFGQRIPRAIRAFFGESDPRSVPDALSFADIGPAAGEIASELLSAIAAREIADHVLAPVASQPTTPEPSPRPAAEWPIAATGELRQLSLFD